MKELVAFNDFYATKTSLIHADKSYSETFLKNIMNRHLLYICEKEEHGPVGFISGFVSPHHFNPSLKCITELFWWVTPEHRKGRAGSMLLDAFIEYGEKECDMILFTLEENSPVNDGFLVKRGFHLKEKNYLKECQ